MHRQTDDEADERLVGGELAEEGSVRPRVARRLPDAQGAGQDAMGVADGDADPLATVVHAGHAAGGNRGGGRRGG